MTHVTRLTDNPRMPRVGQAVTGRYQIERLLGEGGFAAVYAATDLLAGGRLALKVLEPDKSDQPDFAARFRQEVMVVRSLTHHNTIKIWDVGQTETGCLFMAMELIEGEALSTLIAREGALPAPRVHRIVRQTLLALAEAHDRDIVHRDLKPDNIMLRQLPDEPDFVKVLDFGIAKAFNELSLVKTQTGLVMCTAAYAAPELLRNRGVTPATDIYALGLIVIEALTGRPAVYGDSIADLIAQQIAPDPISLPPDLAASPLGVWVAHAVAKDPVSRYADARAMLQSLPPTSALGAASTSTPPVSSPVAAPARASGPQRVAPLVATGPGVPTLSSGELVPFAASPPATAAPRSSRRSLVAVTVALLALAGASAALILGREPTPSRPDSPIEAERPNASTETPSVSETHLRTPPAESAEAGTAAAADELPTEPPLPEAQPIETLARDPEPTALSDDYRALGQGLLPSRAALVDAPTAPALNEGSWLEGGLADADPRTETASPADDARLALADDTSLRLEVRSDAFAPTLTLLRDGEVIARDSGDTRVRFDLDLEAGDYLVRVSGRDATARGGYRLRFSDRGGRVGGETVERSTDRSRELTGSVETETPAVAGHLDRSQVMSVMRSRTSQMGRCYEEGLMRSPDLSGRLEVSFTIDRDGTVSEASIRISTLHDSAVEDCVLRELRRLRFPAPEGGVFRVNYPLIFGPA